MINLSYKFDQNSSSLELSGMPDVSNGDSDETIGILSSWTLKIIGAPILEGEKKHLDYLMQAILQYSRAYISGIRTTFTSKNNVVCITPIGLNHKLLLNSTKEDVKPLEIILDDSELSDLTRCLDLLRFDSRFNLNWDIHLDLPFSKRYILSNLTKSKNKSNIFFSFFIFLLTSSLLIIIPIDNNYEQKESENKLSLNSTFINKLKTII